MILLNLLHKKKCPKCDKTFYANLYNFFKEKRGKYGLRSKCKKCFQAESKIIKTIPENRKKARIASKKYYTKNKKQAATRWQIYYKANSEYLKEKASLWGKNNLDKRKVSDTKRRESIGFRLGSNISRSIRQSLFRYNGKNGAP